jgi:hypothetical protein
MVTARLSEAFSRLSEEQSSAAISRGYLWAQLDALAKLRAGIEAGMRATRPPSKLS